MNSIVIAAIAGFVLGLMTWRLAFQKGKERKIRRCFGSSHPRESRVQEVLFAIDLELANRYETMHQCHCDQPSICWTAIYEQRRRRDEAFAIALEQEFGRAVEARIRAGLPKPATR